MAMNERSFELQVVAVISEVNKDYPQRTLLRIIRVKFGACDQRRWKPAKGTFFTFGLAGLLIN